MPTAPQFSGGVARRLREWRSGVHGLQEDLIVRERINHASHVPRGLP